MNSKLVRGQLIVFAVVSVFVVSYAAYHFMGLQRYTGIGTYTVTVELETSGGLYPRALVTYRGADIGVVLDTDIEDGKVLAKLQLQSDVKVPRDTDAAVRSVFTIGEQYLDLRPTTDSAPFLADGDVIPIDRTSVPVPTSEVVVAVNDLLQSLPKEDLRTTVNEASAAFTGAGPALAQLIDSSRAFISLAQANIGPLQQLITDAEPVLGAINTAGPDIARFSTDLASFSEQLTMNDAQIRAVLDNSPAFFGTVNQTITDISSPLSILLANLQSVGEVLRVNVPGLRQILVIYPAVSASINHSAIGFQGDDMVYGQAPLDLKLGNTANPVLCTEGYSETQRRDPGDVTPAEAAANSYCTLAPDDGRVARGLRNVPCATDPSVRTAEIAQCPGGAPSTWPQLLSRPGARYSPADPAIAPEEVAQQPAGPANLLPPASGAVPYDPGSGRFRTPIGSLYSITPAAHEKELTWQALFQR